MPMLLIFLLLLLPTFTARTHGLVASVCGAGKCRSNDAPGCVSGTEQVCGCVPSVRGTLCAELNFAGHIDNGVAVCARARDTDPNVECAKIVPVTSSVTAVRRRTVISCDCDFSWEYGLFSSSFDATRTGTRDPPSCDECVSFGVGPQPSGVLDVEFGVTPQTCRKYGGRDPALNENSWKECSGHGTWNAVTHACDCDEGWVPRVTSFAGNNEFVATCDVCAPLRGPSPSQSCAVVVTPDPVSSSTLECGGHGVFVGSGCRCFSNSTAGYWTLTNVTREATVWNAAARIYQTHNYSEPSCVACADTSKLPSQGCR